MYQCIYVRVAATGRGAVTTYLQWESSPRVPAAEKDGPHSGSERRSLARARLALLIRPVRDPNGTRLRVRVRLNISGLKGQLEEGNPSYIKYTFSLATICPEWRHFAVQR